MNIAIISDTHNNTHGVDWVISYLNQYQITTTFHAGDLVSQDILTQFINHYHGDFHFVFGNNQRQHDLMQSLANQAPNTTCHNFTMEMTFQDKSIYMNHYTDNSLIALKSGQYDLCIAGHTHRHQIKQNGNSLFLNPGNVVGFDGQDRNRVSSFSVMDITNLTVQQVTVPQFS